MDIFQFMSDSPWTTFFLAMFALAGLRVIFIYSINRPLRHMNIRKHGWPPAHCDGDGDFKTESKGD